MTASEVLERRARELARPRDDHSATRHSVAALRFRHGAAHYLVELEEVHRVVPLDGAARLPRATSPLTAVVSVGPDILAVVSVPVMLAATESPSSMAWAVAVHADGHPLCLAADEVVGIVTLDIDHVRNGRGPGDAGDRGDVARGLTPDGDLLLDLSAIGRSVAASRRGATERQGDPHHTNEQGTET